MLAKNRWCLAERTYTKCEDGHLDTHRVWRGSLQSMHIDFVKMHGLGNDFAVIDNRRGDIALNADLLRRIADRRVGVGCDQVLLAEPPRVPGADIRMRIFNSDGSEAEQCGNGVRCMALFARDQGFFDGGVLGIESGGSVVRSEVIADGLVRVDMGSPALEPAEIPFGAPARAPSYDLETQLGPISVGAVSMGNPHAVVEVPDVEEAPVDTWGPVIQQHAYFPNRCNVGFMEVVGPDSIRLRVYERGVGETRACGSGACAAVVAGRVRGVLDQRVEVMLRGGALSIEWKGEGAAVWMTGPATHVFRGQLSL